MSDLSSLTEILKYARFFYELPKDALLPAAVIGLTTMLRGIYSDRKKLEEN